MTNAVGEASTLAISPPLPSLPVSGGMWAILEDDEGYETYRVGAINEDDGKLTVFATQYNPAKFAETDESTVLGLARASVAGPQIVPSVNSGSIILEVNQ